MDERVVGLPRGALVKLPGRCVRHLFADKIGRAPRAILPLKECLKILNRLVLISAGVWIAVVAAPKTLTDLTVPARNLNLVNNTKRGARDALRRVDAVGFPKSALVKTTNA